MNKNEWKYQDIFFIVSESIKHSEYNKFQEFQLETKESNTSYTWVPGAYSWNRCAQMIQLQQYRTQPRMG